MTLKEFRTKHPDVLLNELKWRDLDAIARGAALFCVTLSNKTGPKENRTIIYADYALTMGMGSTPKTLTVMQTTKSGYPMLRSITENDLQASGHIALFRTASLPTNDPRNTKLCLHWS